MGRLNDQEQKAVNKIVADLNRKRQIEYEMANDPEGYVQKWLIEQKKLGYKRSGQAGWVKIASIPVIMDEYFTKTYGTEYYKEKGFFDRFPEWKVVKDTRTI